MRTQSGLFVALVLLLVMFASARSSASNHKYQHATLVDAGEYDWCHYDCQPFDEPTLYFCVQVQDHTLVGSTGTGWRWAYDNSKMLEYKGKTISIRYNARSIWVIRTDGKEMHLRQNYSRDVFRNPLCTVEIHRHWLQHLANVKRPKGVPQEATLVPQSKHSYFWANCAFNPQANWDVCSVWDSKGIKYADCECVNSQNHRAVAQPGLLIDPLTTTTSNELYLKNGVLLADWAKGRINGKPIPGSLPPLPPLDKPPRSRP